MPQIYIGGDRIGGYDVLEKLIKKNVHGTKGPAKGPAKGPTALKAS